MVDVETREYREIQDPETYLPDEELRWAIARGAKVANDLEEIGQTLREWEGFFTQETEDSREEGEEPAHDIQEILAVRSAAGFVQGATQFLHQGLATLH